MDTTPHAQFVLEPQGPFTLATIRRFQCGLMVASRSCAAGDDEARRRRDHAHRHAVGGRHPPSVLERPEA